MTATRRLIVNADDYGLTPSVSAGIRAAHLGGVVTSTTAMLNQPGVEAALELALRECPRLGLGVHLVLTKGRPLLPPSQLRSLLALGDGTELPSLPHLRAGLTTLKMDEVAAEWQAQVNAFVRITGRAPTHLDSHHHASYFSPALFETMLELAESLGCAIRRPLTSHDPAQSHLGGGVELAGALASRLAQSRVPAPDYFDARFYGEGVSVASLEAIVDDLPAGVSELMCHPGLEDAALATVSSYHRQRAVELAALTAPSVRERVAAAGVRLVDFGGLA